MKHLIEWDQIEARVDGERVNAMAQPMIVPPLERLSLQFTNGLLVVEGSIRKFLSVPFRVEIREIPAAGHVVRVPLRNASAFGGIPIPQFLFRMAKDKLPASLVTFEEPATFVLSLDRFLPSFVHADIQKIWIIDGGLSVLLGRGGADLPPPQGGSDGTGPGTPQRTG